MPFHQPDSYRHCGAKTRAGTLCKSPAMKNGRCRMHGGKTPRGTDSANFKHGYYSTYPLARQFWKFIPIRYQQVLSYDRAKQYVDDNPRPAIDDYDTLRGWNVAIGGVFNKRATRGNSYTEPCFRPKYRDYLH